jgi:peptidylprolyl isomerase
MSGKEAAGKKPAKAKSTKTAAKSTEAKPKATKTTAAKGTTTAAKKAAPKVESVVGEKSLVYIDYVAKTKEDNKIFDVTMEDVAKSEGLYKESGRYEPMLVAIGWNWLLAALEEELIGMKTGEKKTIEVPPEKGAGPKDPNLIKTIAKVKLDKHGVKAIKGEEVNFGREQGVIIQVLGRTVRVDFNNPLAGKTLVFDVTVREIISTPEEKLLAVIKRRVPGLPHEDFHVSIKGKVVTVELPKETRYVENIQYAEIGIAADALKVIEDATEIKMVVTWPRPEPLKEN